MKCLRTILWVLALACLACAAKPVEAQSLSDYTLHAIDALNDELYRYDFRENVGAAVGVVRHAQTGQTMTGIKALAYVPGHQNIFAFWNDPADKKTKLAYINAMTAQAELFPNDFGTGPITAATAVKSATGVQLPPTSPTPLSERTNHKIYAIQHGLTISGKINLNPNNSADSEFILTMPDGSQIVRDDLHDQVKLDPASGTMYFGPATSVRIKPKGSGEQTTLILNGSPYILQNTNTYLIHGEYMTCRVYNDQVTRTGKAMGKWWLEISTGSVVIENWGEAGNNKQSSSAGSSLFGALLRIDPAKGVAVQVMKVSRPYDGLAGEISGRLYAVSAGRVYVLDIVAGTETALGSTIGYANVEALENAGPQLYGFSTQDKRFLPISATSGALRSTAFNIGDVKLRSMVFIRRADEPRSIYGD